MLRLNLDETSQCIDLGYEKGNVFYNKRIHGRDAEPYCRRSYKRRLCITQVGLICDDPAIQKILPQMIIGNEAFFGRMELLPPLLAAAPHNVYLYRAESGWNQEHIMCNLIELLKLILQPYFSRLQPILLMDASPLHLSDRLVRLCWNRSIWPLIIPATCTWLLQPLDTHVFLVYKRNMRRLYQQAQVDEADGDISTDKFLKIMYAVFKQVYNGRNWSYAFDADGFNSNLEDLRDRDVQRQLSNHILHHLRLRVPVRPCNLMRPQLNQLKLCYPKNRAESVKMHLLVPLPEPRQVVPMLSIANNVIDAVAIAKAAGVLLGVSVPKQPPMRGLRVEPVSPTQALVPAGSGSSLLTARPAQASGSSSSVSLWSPPTNPRPKYRIRPKATVAPKARSATVRLAPPEKHAFPTSWKRKQKPSPPSSPWRDQIASRTRSRRSGS